MYDLFIEFITDIMLVKSNGIHNETQSADYKSKMPKKIMLEQRLESKERIQTEQLNKAIL